MAVFSRKINTALLRKVNKQKNRQYEELTEKQIRNGYSDLPDCSKESPSVLQHINDKRIRSEPVVLVAVVFREGKRGPFLAWSSVPDICQHF